MFICKSHGSDWFGLMSCVGADDISSGLSFSCLLCVFGMSLWEGKSLSLISETACLNCNMCVEPVKGISDPSACTAALTCGLSNVSSYSFFLNLLSCRKLQATAMNQVRYGIADSVPNTCSQPKSLSVPLFAEPGRDSNLMHLVSTQGRWQNRHFKSWVHLQLVDWKCARWCSLWAIGRDSNAPKDDLFDCPMQKFHWKMIQNLQMSMTLR